jgi:hypothetical protein
MRDCDECSVRDNPDPEEECRTCRNDARALMAQMDPEYRVTLRSCLMHPATPGLMEIRRLMRAGMPVAQDDLAWWQWQALAAIEGEIDRIHAEELEAQREKEP